MYIIVYCYCLSSVHSLYVVYIYQVFSDCRPLVFSTWQAGYLLFGEYNGDIPGLYRGVPFHPKPYNTAGYHWDTKVPYYISFEKHTLTSTGWLASKPFVYKINHERTDSKTSVEGKFYQCDIKL